MSKKITVKLRPENIENISVRSCRKGVYLTFDAGNIRSIVCKYSEVITICTPKPIYDDERIQLTTVQRNYPIGSVDLNRNHSSDVLV